MNIEQFLIELIKREGVMSITRLTVVVQPGTALPKL